MRPDPEPGRDRLTGSGPMMAVRPAPSEHTSPEHVPPGRLAGTPGPAARMANALLVLLAGVGLITQFVLTGTGPSDPAVPDPGVVPSIVRYLSYFTMCSNIMVALTSLPLALGRPLGPVMRVLRLDAVPCIIVTGVVHWFLLRPDIPPTGPAWLADWLLHIAVPIAMPLVWLLCGPRGLIGRREVLASCLFPVVYALWTFAHGALTGWYPYGFIDVGAIGWGPALQMSGLVFVAVAVLILLTWGVDRLLGRRAGLPDGPGA